MLRLRWRHGRVYWGGDGHCLLDSPIVGPSRGRRMTRPLIEAPIDSPVRQSIDLLIDSLILSLSRWLEPR